MNPEPAIPVTEDGLWSPCADADAQHADVTKSFAVMARHYCRSSDAHRPLVASRPTTSTCATQQAAFDTAHAWELLIEAAIGRGGGHALQVDRVQILDLEGRIVPRRLTLPAGELKSIDSPGAVAQEVKLPHDFLSTGLRP